MSAKVQALIASTKDRLSAAHHIVALTGSGVSAESGVPTFRDAQSGLWAKYSPEELATPEAFARDPQRVWDWYVWRRSLVAKAQPNAGHSALAKLESTARAFTLITQNVDGLHQRAGSRNVVEFHGNLMLDVCSRDGQPIDASALDHSERPPRCPRCGAFARPGVVWFGENIPLHALTTARSAVAHVDVFLSIGTSSLVYPAAGLAEQAKSNGAFVVEINPQPTPLTSLADVVLTGTSATMLPLLVGEPLGR